MFNMYRRKKNSNENYVESDFIMGTVLVMFSFFSTDEKTDFFSMDFSPWLPICKKFNIHRRKKNFDENYVEFDFSMGTVLVIF